MRMKFSKQVSRFPEYAFAGLNRKVKDVEQRTGRKVLNFGAGSPDITPSKTYLDKLKELICENGMHLYPGYTAIPEFSNALIHWYWKKFGVALTEEELMPLLGSKDMENSLSWRRQ